MRPPVRPAILLGVCLLLPACGSSGGGGGNVAPIIHSINATPDPLPLAGTLTAWVTASDPNGDALTYTWSVPSGFAIVSGQGTSLIVVSSSVVASGDLAVEVDDGTAAPVEGLLGISSRHGWGPPTPLEALAAPLNDAPKVAASSTGDAMAIWVQHDAGVGSIWAARHTTAGGWEAAQTVESGAAAATSPEIVVDFFGNAIAVWTQADGGVESVWANRFTPAGGWGTAAPLEASAQILVSQARLAGDIAGNAVAVWNQSDGAGVRIWMAFFTPGGGWAAATILDQDAATPAARHSVAMNPGGDALVVWHQSMIRAREYSSGGGWAPAVTDLTGAVAAVGSTETALSENLNAVAVWTQTGAGELRRHAARFTAGVGWVTDGAIDGVASSAILMPHLNSHTVGIDDFGYGMAFWSQPEDTGNVSIWVNRLTTAGWTGAELLETESGGFTTPTLAVGRSGTVLALCNSGARSLSFFFTAAQGWGPPEEVCSPAGSPRAAWSGDTVFGVYANADVIQALRWR